VTILVDVALIGGGVLLGRWIARQLRARRGRDVHVSAIAPEAKALPPATELPASFPCKLGDVLVRTAARDEAWLAGALIFSEERPIAALFVAPEAGGDRALFVRDAPGSGVTWLAPIAKAELALPPEPPFTIEHAGVRYERARRLPVSVARVGSGAPAVGAQAIVAEYAGAGTERLVVVAGTEQSLAWKGESLSESEYDVLPGDKSTLEA
jgi:hypothetical protein